MILDRVYICFTEDSRTPAGCEIRACSHALCNNASRPGRVDLPIAAEERDIPDACAKRDIRRMLDIPVCQVPHGWTFHMRGRRSCVNNMRLRGWLILTVGE